MQQKQVKNPFQLQEKRAISFRNDSNFLLQKKIAQQEDIEDFQNDSIHISPTILFNKDKNCEKQALNNLKQISHQEQIYQFQTENQNQNEELKNSFIVDNWKNDSNQNPYSNKLKQISMGIEINPQENLNYKNNFTNNFVAQSNTIPKQTSENIKNILQNPRKSDNFRRSTVLRYKSTQNFKEIQNKENKVNSNLEQEKQRQQFSQIMQKLKILHRMLEKTDEYIPPPQDAILFHQNRENYIKQILQKPKNQVGNYLNPNFHEFSQINQQENTKPTQSIASLDLSLNDTEKQKETIIQSQKQLTKSNTFSQKLTNSLLQNQFRYFKIFGKVDKIQQKQDLNQNIDYLDSQNSLYHTTHTSTEKKKQNKIQKQQTLPQKNQILRHSKNSIKNFPTSVNLDTPKKFILKQKNSQIINTNIFQPNNKNKHNQSQNNSKNATFTNFDLNFNKTTTEYLEPAIQKNQQIQNQGQNFNKQNQNQVQTQIQEQIDKQKPLKQFGINLVAQKLIEL